MEINICVGRVNEEGKREKKIMADGCNNNKKHTQFYFRCYCATFAFGSFSDSAHFSVRFFSPFLLYLLVLCVYVSIYFVFRFHTDLKINLNTQSTDFTEQIFYSSHFICAKAS